MMAKFYNSELRDILNDNSKYKENVTEVFSKMNSLDYCNDLTEGLQYVLESANAEPIELLLGLRLVKDCLLHDPSLFLPFFLAKILLPIERIGEFKAGDDDPKRGQDFFGVNAEPDTKKLGMSLLRFSLEFIEVSTRLFPPEEEIQESYKRLKSKQVAFPQSLHYFKNMELDPIVYQKKEVNIKTVTISDLCHETLQILRGNNTESLCKEKLLHQISELRSQTMSNGNHEEEITRAEKQISLLQSWKDSVISYDELRGELLEHHTQDSHLSEKDGYEAISKASDHDYSLLFHFQDMLKDRVKAKAMKDIEIIILSLHSAACKSPENLSFIDIEKLRPAFINILGNFKDKIIVNLVSEFAKCWKILSFETSESADFQVFFRELLKVANFSEIKLDESSLKCLHSNLILGVEFDSLSFKKKAIQNFKYFLSIFFTEAEGDFQDEEMFSELLGEAKSLLTFNEVFLPDSKLHISLSLAHELLEKGKGNLRSAYISLKKNQKFLELKGLAFIFLGVEMGSLYDQNFHVFYLNEFFKKYEIDFRMPETGTKLNEFLKTMIEEPAYRQSASEGNRIDGELKFLLKNFNFPNVDYGEVANVNNSSFFSISSRSSRIIQTSHSQSNLNMSLRSVNSQTYEGEADLLKENHGISKEIRSIENEIQLLKISNLKLTQNIKKLHRQFNGN